MRFGVAVVSSIALIAAGIGIMNIMLVSVTERTREIGIRRAIGYEEAQHQGRNSSWKRSTAKSAALSASRWGRGGNSVALLMKVPPVIPFDWIALGLGICSVVGVVFGTYPAWKAANLNPIESLRYE